MELTPEQREEIETRIKQIEAQRLNYLQEVAHNVGRFDGAVKALREFLETGNKNDVAE